MTRITKIGALVVLLAGLGACKQESTSTSAPPPPTETTADELANVRSWAQDDGKPPAAPESADLPPGHPPIGDMGAGGDMPAASEPPVTGRLTYEAPEAWQREPVTSSMRKDQFALPAPVEDAPAAELAVFYFGAGGAGGIKANLDRWRSQFTDEEGNPVGDDATHQENLEANGLNITVLELAGQYAGAAMGMGQTETKENYGMIAAIVETPDGPWFFKAVGPQATVASHRDRFIAFLKTMQYDE